MAGIKTAKSLLNIAGGAPKEALTAARISLDTAGLMKTAVRGAISGAAIGGAGSMLTGGDFWDGAGKGAVLGGVGNVAYMGGKGISENFENLDALARTRKVVNTTKTSGARKYKAPTGFGSKVSKPLQAMMTEAKNSAFAQKNMRRKRSYR